MTTLGMVRLALAGSQTDAARVVLTAISAALAMLVFLAAATVIAIPEKTIDPVLAEQGPYSEDNTQYTLNLLAEPGLRPGVVFALVLLTIPVLSLAAQCGRLGAPDRDRRLAAIRMAGATPRQAVQLVATETGLASALGAVGGLGIYLVGRRALHSPDERGQLLLPTDVLPSPLALALLTVTFPVLATVIAAWLLRRVTIGPFGVVRRTRRESPRPWPGFLIIPGVGVFVVLEPLSRLAERQGVSVPAEVVLAAVFMGALLAVIGVVVGTGWIANRTGRVLLRYGRRPATLLAARRLIADPWSGSRAFAAVLTGVVFGAGAIGIRASLTLGFREEDVRNQDTSGGEVAPTDRSFYFDSLDLLDAAVYLAIAVAAGGLLVALAEGIVSRRRAYASLTATGVPRSVLAKATMWQAMAPAVPAVALAAAVGTALTYAYGRPSLDSDVVSYTAMDLIALDRLAVLSGGTVAVVALIACVGLLFLRQATAPEELRTT